MIDIDSSNLYEYLYCTSFHIIQLYFIIASYLIFLRGFIRIIIFNLSYVVKNYPEKFDFI